MISEGLKKFLDRHEVKDQEDFDRENIRSFAYTYIRSRSYISYKNITGDFLDHLGYDVQRTKCFPIKKLRSILSHSFSSHLQHFVEEGLLIKYNAKTYKVV